MFCFSIGAEVSVYTNSTESTNCVFINCLIGVVVLLIALPLGIFLSCLLSHLYHQCKLKVTTGKTCVSNELLGLIACVCVHFIETLPVCM